MKRQDPFLENLGAAMVFFAMPVGIGAMCLLMAHAVKVLTS